MTNAQTEAGEVVRLCPGWSGNKFRCGRGEARVLKGDADLCGSCKRAAEKAGDRESAREAAERAANEEYLRRISALAAKVRTEPELAEAISTVAPLLRRVDALTRSDWRATSSNSFEHQFRRYDDAEKIATRDRLNVLKALAGIDPGDRGEW